MGTKHERARSRSIDRRTFLRQTTVVGVVGASSLFHVRRSLGAIKDIEVAFIQPRSGPMVPIATPPVLCAAIAVDEINAAGGIRSLGGAKLKLLEYDNEGKPEVGVSMVERAARSDAVAIVGSMQSGVVMVQTLTAERNRIPNIVDVAIADDITARNLKYVFQVCPSTEQMILSDLKFIKALEDARTGKRVQSIAVMYEDTAFGQSVFNNIKKHHAGVGLNLVSSVGYNWKNADLTSPVIRVKAANPDLVYISGYVPDTILILKTLYSLKVPLLAIHGGPNGSTDEFYDATKPLSEFVLYTDWWSPEIIPGAPKTRGANIIEAYSKRSDGKPVNGEGIKTLSAFHVLKKALEASGDRSRDKLRDALERVTATGADGIALPYTIKFDAQHRVEGAFSVAGQWQKAEKKTVFPRDVASAPIVFPHPGWK